MSIDGEATAINGSRRRMPSRGSAQVGLAPRLIMLTALGAGSPAGSQVPPDAELHDSHFHLTNYIQEGLEMREFLEIMGNEVGRVAIFGIPLQQTWSYENSGDFAPTYYLQTDAPLYYYSFTDAFIAMQYLSLTPAEQARFEPMITGFNPADMYGVDHIKRVLATFPGVFSGIGEFSIHKEFVSSKVAGDTASLTDPAIDRILEFAGEAGLVVIFHNDIDMPFGRPDTEPLYLAQMKSLLRRHPNATIIWAHLGLGRIVFPVRSSVSPPASPPPAERAPGQMGRVVLEILEDPALDHVHFDLSWDELAKYIVGSPDALGNSVDIINAYPDRFLFGTDEVAPPDQTTYLGVYERYAPLWAALTPEAREKVLKGNHERLFDAARRKVRAWEQENLE